jgi:hypothetical protein
MGFNRRKMEAQRAEAAEKKAAARWETDAQILEDTGRLVAAWNERQAKRTPMLFSSTIGCALKARHWFLWVCCPACRTTQAVDLRTLDRHPWSALTGLIPALSCRSCRPHAPFAELVRLSKPASPMKFVRIERGSQTGVGSHILATDRIRATAIPAPIAKTYGCQSGRVPSVAKVFGFRF